jgi:MmyB-like transcription regulator ligand binding domain
VQRILDGMTDVAAFVRDGRLDIPPTSRLGYALYSPVYDDPDWPVNLAPFAFLDPRSHRLLPELGRRGQHHHGIAAHRGPTRPL